MKRDEFILNWLQQNRARLIKEGIKPQEAMKEVQRLWEAQ